MENNTEIDILNEKYILNQMVYVNSANHGYSEITLNYHLAMFGRNNAGKTASLAGTKLLLFPEVNFYNCDKKFKFAGKLGIYSMEQSYDFYFPDAKSFLILEVENPEGIFCMILYKTNNYGYGRFFVPRHYDDIRHLFWNSETDDFSDGLNIKSVSRFVKENDGIQETDPKEIAYLMYDSFKGDKRKKRFCVLPLKDARTDSINAFKNIYQLAFDTGNTETETLPDAIATLLEMGRGRDEERLDANLIQLSEEHSNLVAKQNWLQSLANAKPLFQQVQSDYAILVQKNISYSNEYRALEMSVMKEKQEYLPNIKNAQSNYNDIKQEEEEINNEIIKLNETVIRDNEKIRLYEEALAKEQSKLRDAKQFVSRYKSTSISVILEELQNQSSEAQKALNEYKKEGGIKSSLEANIREKKQLNGKLNKINEIIDNYESSVLHQLHNIKSASTLLSLNENLASITSLLNDDDKSTIQSFADLFDVDAAGYLTFLGGTVMDTYFTKYNKESEISRLMNIKDDFITKITKLNNAILSQQEALKHNEIEKLINETENELQNTFKNIEMVSGLATLEKEISEKNNQIESQKDLLTKNRIQLEKLKHQHSKTKSDAYQIKTELDKLLEKKEKFTQIDNILEKAKLLWIPGDVDDIKVANISVEKSFNVHEAANECKVKQAQLSSLLDKLMSKVKHPDIDPHKEYISLDVCGQVVQTYSHAYSTLEYDLNQHLNEIRSHNQFVSNQLNELKEAKHFLTTYISEINSELNAKHVSNLSEISLKLNINKRFESLIATLDKHDIQDESLLDEQFYVSLSKFVESYFNKKTRRLKMHDIIESINYEYTLAETGESVTKSQSGGTTSTITAFVLSVLLKRITPTYVSLHIPIIVDEISTLDFENTDATIKQIADHGFSIFCATPSFSGFISQKVGRWIMIDRMRVRHPMVSKCHMNILPKYVESFGEMQREA